MFENGKAFVLRADWGDENAPCLVAAIPPGFIPPKLSRGLVRERRVGGLKPWRSGLVQSLLTPAPFEFVRSPTHHFPSRSMSFVRRSDELARKMVGWTPCKIVGPSISREVELATTPGDRPIHPTIPNQPRADCREREQIPAEKNLPKLDNFHHPTCRLPEDDPAP